MSVLLVPLIFTALCWLVSLRRTPFAVGWLAISAVGVGFGMLIVSAASAVHHTAPGLVAAVLASCVVPAVMTAAVEGCAACSPGTAASDVAKWRRDHARRLPSGARWTVITKAQRENGENTVWLGVRSGETTRWIGHADPLDDMDAFMELRVKADQAAETLNALKISS